MGGHAIQGRATLGSVGVSVHIAILSGLVALAALVVAGCGRTLEVVDDDAGLLESGALSEATPPGWGSPLRRPFRGSSLGSPEAGISGAMRHRVESSRLAHRVQAG
jgi:hypothetical protein